MISVLTITYKRPHLLEEAIESFLRQRRVAGAEMVIVNDNPEVDYVYDHPSIKIFNVKERFPSIAAKLKWGYKQCTHNFIYRLDDDDLLAPEAIYNVAVTVIESALDYDIYRSKDHFFFVNNKFEKKSSNINNGNVYTKKYLDRITWPHKSGDEDAEITFSNGAVICEKVPTSMIYRWGMETLHISGMGIQPSEVILAQADKVLTEPGGVIQLNPHFDNDYYSELHK
jgi:glycosyltransferase involved in cell wall biosynthesis